MCGSSEKDHNGNKFPGAYPAGFLKRLKKAFEYIYPTNPRDILHVCSGRIPPEEGIRIDLDPSYNPDYLDDVETMKDISDDLFQWVMADPPYNNPASQKYYKMKMPNKAKMIKQMVRVCKVDGYVSILDQISPNSVSRCLKRVAIIGITSVPNQDLRVFTVFKKISSGK